MIDPGRAFGTGAHPTTRLCVELLAAQSRGSLLDAGCGSGVVALAAVRLGFGPVIAVDVDPVAVTYAVTTQHGTVSSSTHGSSTCSKRSSPSPTSSSRTSRSARSRRFSPVYERVGRSDPVTSQARSRGPRLEAVEERGLDGWAAHVPTGKLGGLVATFSVSFLGCKVSFADAQATRQRLVLDGHTESYENADVVVVNTCA